MATKAPPTNFADEPSIIIDPSVYVPEQRWLLQTVCETFIDVTRVLVAITLSGTAAFSIAHVLMERHFALEQPAAARAQVRMANAVGALSRPPASVAGPGAVSMDLNFASAPAGSCAAQASALCTQSEAAPSAPVAARAKLVRPVVDVAAGVRTARRMLALNRLDEAEAAYRKVLVVDEHQPAALTGLARIHLARGALDDALVLAQRAVELAPDQASGQLALGDALRAKGVRPAGDAQAQVELAAHPAQEQAAPGAEDLVPQSL
jgi:tetratricopeptide (TPR) repeat protein